MSYATMMVHLELGRSNAAILKFTAGLAEQFGATVIGLAVCQPMQIAYGDGYLAGDLEENDRAQKAKEIEEAEAEFRALLAPATHRLQWRSAITAEPLWDHCAQAARVADLIVTRRDRALLLDRTRHFNTGDLVMRAGRPVLIVPGEAETAALDHVVVAWKDTRETRRAAADALPLLGPARRVSVVAIAPESRLPETRESLADVVQWLSRHGIAAAPVAVASTGADAIGLARFLSDQRADLIVAGAYGHGRLREWVFGGVTLDLLLNTPRLALLSH